MSTAIAKIECIEYRVIPKKTVFDDMHKIFAEQISYATRKYWIGKMEKLEYPAIIKYTCI